MNRRYAWPMVLSLLLVAGCGGGDSESAATAKPSPTPAGAELRVHMHCNRLLSRPAPTEQHVLGLALRAREGLERAPLRRPA